MSTHLETVQRLDCTYEDCDQSFPTWKAMISHKKHSQFHDYCHKCDQDFDSYEDLAQHKAFRPDNHDKACRVCGEEFKSTSGLRRHIELNHKVDQKLKCLGCEQDFYRASLLVEHLEFGHCNVIAPEQFLGHIVHKHLVTELLSGGPALELFQTKTAQYDGAQDFDKGGGVPLDNVLEIDGDDGQDMPEFKAIAPVVNQDEVVLPETYPSLPTSSMGSLPPASMCSRTPSRMSSQPPSRMSRKGSEATDLSSTLGRLTMSEVSSNATATADRRLKAWGGRTSQQLFPQAKPTPPPSEFSISHHDEQIDRDHGINIFKTRFWDPLSGDFNPERFYNSVISKYYCPFPCEQVFSSAQEMNEHILATHRVSRIKCPSCLKYYKSVTALIGHCEARGSKCTVSKADDFNIFLDKVTGGFISVEEKTRPEFLHNPAVLIKDPETLRIEMYTPPTASYLQYTSSKPIDWKEPEKVAGQIGVGGDAFNYKGSLRRWAVSSE